MPNRQLNDNERVVAKRMLAQIREWLLALAKDDPRLLFAFRRSIYKGLLYDERGTPAHRKKLKQQKHRSQDGCCALCKKVMPAKHSELDRYEAWKGYTDENTRLVCHDCHIESQDQKKYT